MEPEREEESSSSNSGSLTDLSSLSEVEGVPSHRRYSSTSYILKKETYSSVKATPPLLATQLENPTLCKPGKDFKQLPGDGEDRSRQLASQDLREHESISSLDENHTTKETVSPTQNQTNRLSKSNRSEILITSIGSSVENGTCTHARSGGGGHLFTEEEVKSLQQQIADMQVDIEQLLLYSQMLAQENSALKKVLKNAIIVDDDQSMRQFCDTLLVSIHEQPLLRSGVDYDHLASFQFPRQKLGKLHEPSHPTLAPASKIDWGSTAHDTAALHVLTPPLSQRCEQVSSSYHALEVSVVSQKVTSLKTPPLDPQATSVKGTIQPLDSDISSAQQAAESIRKLYDLTFTESQKAKNEKVVAEREAREVEEEGIKSCTEEKEKAATAGSGPFLSLRRSFKISPRGARHGESKKITSRSEGSPDLPHVGSNSLARRKTVSSTKIERPKFYLRDILPVLQEKNKLKEQVHLLEYEVESLKSECGRLRTSNNTWLNRHSWAGMLVDTPEEVPTLSESPPPGDGKPRTITMRLQPALCDRNPYFTDAVATEYKQHGLHKGYSLEVTRSDGQRFEIYRRYGEFFSFHHTLVQLFPAEAGTYNLKQKVLPSLPSIENVLMKSHLKSINKYCQILLAKVDSSISRSLFVTNFFTPSQKDKQLPRLAKPHTKSELGMSDNFQMSIASASPVEEEYVILADYTTEMEGELTVSAGDVVQLINRDTTGWWLVSSKVKHGEPEKVGRVPGDFLKRYDHVSDQDLADDINSTDSGKVSFDAILGGIADSAMVYVAIETYQTQDPHQISFEEGTQLVVLEICEDGWWLAMADGKEGWVPASYLSPGTTLDGDVSFEWTVAGGKTTGLKYITMAAFEAQYEADVSFPECAVVDVISRWLTGWWQIRYNDCVGLAPASLLALTDVDTTLDSEISEEEKMALSIDLSHSISGYVDPPTRSQRYLSSLRTTTLVVAVADGQ